MKTLTPSSTSAARRGSVLMQALITTGILGIMLASVLSYTRHQSRLISRAQHWNSAFSAAEAGIEEAMSHLIAVGTGARNANGWVSANGGFTKTNSLNSELRYRVLISSNSPPVITSTGFSRMIVAGTDLSRTIRVTTAGQGEFMRALTVRGKVNMSGQFEIDSFNSDDPNYSTGGLWDITKRRQNGDVATMYNGEGAIDMSGQTWIRGRALTAPTGTIKSSSSGQITGGTQNNFNTSFPPKTIPSGNLVLPAGGTVGGVYYNKVLTAGSYFASTVSLSGSTKWLISGDVTLVVDKDWSQSGDASVIITHGGSLKLYVKEGSVSISGSGVANQTGRAANLSLIGRSHTYRGGSITQKGLENVTYSGDSAFIGTIYAPDAVFTVSGGTSSYKEMSGAAVAAEFSGSGYYRLHYDEALGSGSSGALFTINSWREL